MRPRIAPLAAALLAAWCIAFPAAAQPMGKTKEYRSLNSDLYKISIQKDGRLDVTLATDVPVITDVFPMIWFEGEAEPERMQIKGAWTERYLVEDKLGQGQGIHHLYKGTHWSLRAYPTRPYFAVQLGYTNETKKPVRVKALLPWCVGAPAKGMLTLGPGTDSARVLSGITSGSPLFSDGAGQSQDAMAVFNNLTGQSFIAGFLTQDHSRGVIEVGMPSLEDEKNPAGLRSFRAMSVFEEPIELAPGETLESEVLYLAISELDPVIGLQRYARAVQVVNGLSGPEHDAPLHAWVIPTDPAPDLDDLALRLRHAKSAVPLNLVGSVLIGSPASPARTIGVDPRLVSLVQAEGYMPVLWFDPLAGGFDSISNPTPEAQRTEAARIQKQFGTVAVAGIHLDDAMPLRTAHAAILAFREGLGPEARVYGAEPSLLAATLFDGVISNAKDRRYLAPQPARHAVAFDPATATIDSLRAEVTAATLGKSGLLLPLPPADDTTYTGLVARVLPSPQTAARAIDLFAAQTPRAFHMTTKSPDGDVHVAAVMNWDGTEPLSVALPLARIGFAPGAYHSVYDYWQQKYLGTAADTLNVTIPAHGSTVLVFRPVITHPMLAATGLNLGQDWPALRTADWNPQSRTYTVVPAGLPGTTAPWTFTLAIPAPYRLTGAESLSAPSLKWESSGASATIEFPSASSAEEGFSAKFSAAP